MKALALRTRIRLDDRDGDACLLVYDSSNLSAYSISSDVRDILTRRPNTPWIYVLCPFLDHKLALSVLFDGYAPDRASFNISLVHLTLDSEKWLLKHSTKDGTTEDLHPELVHGWLFDLFDSRNGLVKAPAGVHFSKLSGQHTDSFLRTSNVLLTSSAVGAIAFFALSRLGNVHIKRVFVDTAPLLSVAFAIPRVAKAYGITATETEVESFSSYGGIGNLPPLGSHDLFLLSASTSGSLARELLNRGATNDMLVTLYFLGKTPSDPAVGQVVCNLTYSRERSFGYMPVANSRPDNCQFCKQGYLTAPLEGDQFLLEKRDVARMRISSASQPKQARETVEALARNRVFSVDIFSTGLHTNVRVDLIAALRNAPKLKERTLRLLGRFSPNPLSAVVLVDISREQFQELKDEACLGEQWKDCRIYSYEDLASMQPHASAKVLVLIGYLDDHAKVRSVNAQMRVKAPHGDVAYLSVFTIVESAQGFRELEMFLTYGERGPETFTFKSAMSLMLPGRDNAPTSWSQELELLQRMSSSLKSSLATLLQNRLDCLRSAGDIRDYLFIDGKTGPLSIAADFVYLSTDSGIDLVTQADVYAVVSNLLATARCNDVGLGRVNTNSGFDDCAGQSRAWRSHPHNSPPLSTACPYSGAM